jgi:hypothetical protein
MLDHYLTLQMLEPWRQLVTKKVPSNLQYSCRDWETDADPM